MKRKSDIGKRLKMSMIFLVVTLLLTAVLSFWSARRFVNQIHDLGEIQLPGVSNMILADMMHDGIRANVYRAILVSKSKNPDEIKEVKDESLEFSQNIQTYISELQKINLNPKTKKAIGPALPRINEYVQSAREIVDIALSGDEDKARNTLPLFNEKFEALEKELGILGDLIREDSSRSSANGAVIQQTATYLNLGILFVGVGLMIYFALVIRDQQKQLKQNIQDLNNQSSRIHETASQLGISAQNLSSSTAEQSSAFQESAAALEEISSTVRTTEINTNQLDTNAKLSFEAATNGKQTIEEMLLAMDVISTSNSNMMNQMEQGNQQVAGIITVISEIENKTKIINDIVFQTKLLSFNASVEAARAGEQGKGFAVVAEEVGNLAQMSGNAAKEISELLTTSIKTVESIVTNNKTKVESLARDGDVKIKQGIEIAHKCGNALEDIVREASRISVLISEITVAVKEQAQGISEVTNAMGLLDRASNQNAVTSKEYLGSSEDLKDQLNQLEGVVISLSSMIASR